MEQENIELSLIEKFAFRHLKQQRATIEYSILELQQKLADEQKNHNQVMGDIGQVTNLVFDSRGMKYDELENVQLLEGEAEITFSKKEKPPARKAKSE